jgi:hypothetical protein
MKIFDVLLRKKYKDVHYFDQYRILLRIKWNEALFDEIMGNPD